MEQTAGAEVRELVNLRLVGNFCIHAIFSQLVLTKPSVKVLEISYQSENNVIALTCSSDDDITIHGILTPPHMFTLHVHAPSWT